MIKHPKVRITICICMIITAIVLAIVFDGILTGPQTEMWQRLVYINAIIGTGIAGFIGLFAGYRGFLSGYLFTLMISLPVFIPETFKGWFAVIVIGAVMLLPYIRNRSKKRKAGSTTDGEEEEYMDELTDEEAEELEKYAGLTIVMQQGTGWLYQLMPRDGKLLAYRIGGELKGVDSELIQEDNAEPRPLGKRDFCVDIAEIKRVAVQEEQQGSGHSLAVMNSGKRSIFRFYSMTKDHEQYSNFWKDLVPDKVTFPDAEQAAKERAHEDYREPNEKRLAVLKVVKYIIAVYMAVVNLLWLFVDVPYDLFSLLSLLTLPVLLALYFIFPNELTLLERSTGSEASRKKVSLSALVLLSGTFASLRTLMDFNFRNGWSVVLTGLLVAAAGMALFLLLSREWKVRKIIIFYMALSLLFYAPGAVGQLNYIPDNSVPSVEQGVIINMHISKSRRGPDSYYLKIRTDSSGEILELKTGEEHYYSLGEGDKVDIYTFSGALGFSYSYVK